jgi:hypothetical protein
MGQKNERIAGCVRLRLNGNREQVRSLYRISDLEKR